ncbi:potassium voltage-gated channel subfamily kqt member 5 [Biomphalaria glabrata]|nr:potassium voltage-gated channel subfamily KQT member 5-like isoform X3 [Biomphalaria glabrata]
MTSLPAAPLAPKEEGISSGSGNVEPPDVTKSVQVTSGSWSSKHSGSSASGDGDSLTTALHSHLDHGILSHLDIVHSRPDNKRCHGNGSPAIIKYQCSPFTTTMGSLTSSASLSASTVMPSAPVTPQQEAFFPPKIFTSDKKKPSKKLGPISGDVTDPRTRSDVGCVSDKNATNNSARGHRSPRVTSHARTSPGTPPRPLPPDSPGEAEERRGEGDTDSSAQSSEVVDSSKSVPVPSTDASPSDACTPAIHHCSGELAPWESPESDWRKDKVQGNKTRELTQADNPKGRFDPGDTRVVAFHQTSDQRRHSNSGLRLNSRFRNVAPAKNDLNPDPSLPCNGAGRSCRTLAAEPITDKGHICDWRVQEHYHQSVEDDEEVFVETSQDDTRIKCCAVRPCFLRQSAEHNRSSPKEDECPEIRINCDGVSVSLECDAINGVAHDVPDDAAQLDVGMIDVSLCKNKCEINYAPPMVRDGHSFPSDAEHFDNASFEDDGEAFTHFPVVTPSIQITSTPTKEATSDSPTLDTDNPNASPDNAPCLGADKSTVSGPQATKLRETFINGLRRLSREKNSFLRIDHSYNYGRPSLDTQERGSSGCTFLFPGPQSHLSSSPKGVVRGPGERRKLKVEFAVMEEEGHKLNRPRARGGGGEYGVKDEVDNHVAMLGGNSARFRQPRVSLLGKPLNYRAHRRDMRYRRIQARIYNFLERPKNWGSWMYHFLM